MPRLIDKSGQRHGRLVVTDDKLSRGNKVYWRCICDCGNEKWVQSIALGRTTNSCGCMKHDWSIRRTWKDLTPIQRAGWAFYNEYAANCKRRNIEMRLTRDEFNEIAQKPCAYCGKSGDREMSVNVGMGKRVVFRMNGIDRVDNDKCYSIENCVSCCSECNKYKRDNSVDQFLGKVADIYRTCLQERCQEAV